MTSIQNFSTLSRVVSHINNPNYITGTLIEELPTDVGRSYAGYKRGGVLEGLEKARKELMSAAVWMLGIPIFNKIGNFICETCLNIPTAIDFSNAKEGNDTITNSIKFLNEGKVSENGTCIKHLLQYKDDLIPKQNFIDKLLKRAPKAKSNIDLSQFNDYEKEFLTKGIVDGIDVSDLMKYGDKYTSFSSAQVENLIKNVSSAKKITSLSAVVLNCIAMGVIIPKINQKMTENLLKKQKANTDAIERKNFSSIDEFINQTNPANNKNISFTGEFDLADTITYNTENNNKFRLLITDIPMIIGRMITSRNKYEALEYLFMDGASAYFYNFSCGHVKSLLQKSSKIPEIEAKTAEMFTMDDYISKIKNACNSNISLDFSKLKNKSLSELETLVKQSLNDENGEFLKEIYKKSTYGKYGKINKFVKNNELKSIDLQILQTLDYIKTHSNGKTDETQIKSAISKINKSNALYLSAGLAVSIIGLALIIPKLTFLMTEKLTGKNEFTGISNYNDNDTKKSS